MTTEFIWQLPTGGDGRYGNAQASRRGERSECGEAPFTAGVSDPRGDRYNYFDYLHQVARAADMTGFDGVLVRDDPDGDESWIVAAYLARGTRHLKLIAGFDASWGSAVYAAKNAVSFQRASGGRFAWQIGQGPDAATRRRHADQVEDQDVLARIDEFVTVARGVQTAAPFDSKGRFFEVQGGGFRGPLAGNPLPPVYLDGDSEAAFALSARQADVHVLAAAPLAQLRPAIERLQALAAQAGRALAIGLRIDVLARESAEEAQRDGERYWSQTGRGAEDPAGFAGSGYWEGFATQATGARGALVGSYAEIEERLAQYAEAGISSFVLGATPHLEEAWRFGEHLLPRLRARLDQERQAA
jgi:alkanesulfonate monooxygenase